MPKARKKREKAKDFAKPKLKLGKQLTTNATHTNTSFRSKSVAVPTQKISKHAVEDEDQASKNQRFMRDRFTQLNHPNMQTRVDALRALDQLLAEDPQLLLTQISPLIQDTVKLMIDIEPRVRKQLLQLYQRHLSTVASDLMFPFFGVLALYTGSAFTHIMDDIRVDALCFLKLWLETFPLLTAKYSGNRFLPSLLQLLNRSATSSTLSKSKLMTAPNSRFTTHTSRLGVLNTINCCLNVAINRRSESYSVSLLHSPEDYEWSQQQPCLPSQIWHLPAVKRPPLSLADLNISAVLPLKKTGDDLLSTPLSSPLAVDEVRTEYQLDQLEDVVALLAYLSCITTEIWIEIAPDVFSDPLSLSRTHSSPESVRALCEMMKMWHRLWIHMLSLMDAQDGAASCQLFSWIIDRWHALEKHVFPRFPINTGTPQKSKRSPTDVLFRQLNQYWCEWTSVLLAHPFSMQILSFSSHRRLLQELKDYLLQSFTYQVAEGTVKLEEGEWNQLLPTAKNLLSSLKDEEQTELLQSIFEAFHRQSPSSNARANVFAFLKSVVRIQLTGKHQVLPFSTDMQRTCVKWLLSLARYLWELKTSNLELTRDILHFLTELLRRHSTKSLAPAHQLVLFGTFMEKMAQSLLPFFHVHVRERSVFGPFKDLPVDIQRQAIGLAVTVMGDQKSSSRIRAAVNACRFDGSVFSHWDELQTVISQQQ